MRSTIHFLSFIQVLEMTATTMISAIMARTINISILIAPALRATVARTAQHSTVIGFKCFRQILAITSPED